MKQNAKSTNYIRYKDKIFIRLIDTPTKISPVKAAAAPATAT